MRKIWWYVFLTIDAVLLLLVTGALSARYVSHEHLWWLQLLAILLPLLSVGLSAALVVHVFAGRIVWSMAHLVLLGIFVWRLVPPMGAGASGGAGAGDLSIVTYNIGRAKEADMRPRVADIQELARTSLPHLLCFQETDLHGVENQLLGGQSVEVIDLLYNGYEMGLVRQTSPDRFKIHQPILARIPTEEPQQVSLRVPPTDRRSFSLLTRTHATWEGRDIVVYNVHLKSFDQKPWDSGTFRGLLRQLDGYREDILIRTREARMVRGILEDERHPFILCGDLNSTPHNWTYTHLARGLRDAFNEVGRGWGATWPARLPLVRIDHIMVSSEWQVVSARALRTGYSDHLPVAARLRLRDP